MVAIKNLFLLLRKPKEYYANHQDPKIGIGLAIILMLVFLSTLLIPMDTTELEISESLIGVLYVVQGIMAVVSVLLTVVLMTVFTWTVVKLFRGELTFGTAFKHNILLYLPMALGLIWGALIARLNLPGILNLNLVGGMINHPSGSILYNIGRRIDIFSIWSVILLFFFLHIGVDINKKKSGIAAILVWLLANLPPAIFFS